VHGVVEAGAFSSKVCVIDPNLSWTVEPSRLASLSHNTPYGGRTLRGKVRHVVWGCEAVVIDGEIQES
jgi:dihydroorotase